MSNVVQTNSSGVNIPDAKSVRLWTASRWDLLLVAGVLLVYAAVALSSIAPKKYGDLDFHREAKVLASAIRGEESWERVEFIRAPGPSLFYAVPYLTVPSGAEDGTYWTRAFAWTTLWTVVAILWIRRASRTLFGERAGKLAAILTLATPLWAYYSYGINGESCAFFSLAIATGGWALWVSDTTRPRMAAFMTWGGVVFFLLCKPNALPLLAFAALSAWALARTGDFRSKKIAGFIMAGVVVAGMLVALSTVGVRRSNVWRPIPPQTRYLRWTAFFGSFQLRTEPFDWRFWGEETRHGSVDYANFELELAKLERQSVGDNIRMSQLEWDWATQDFLAHPLLRLRMAASRTLMMHVPFAGSQDPQDFHLGPLHGAIGFWTVQAIPALGYLLLGIGGVVFLIRQGRDSALYWILWAPWFAVVAFHALIYAEPRYLFPAQAGLIIMCSAVLSGSRGLRIAPVLDGQAQQPDASPVSNRVLCVDLDGTLVRTNTLVESAIALLRRNPWDLPRMIGWGWRGQAYLWDKLSSANALDVRSLPYRNDVVDFVRSEQKKRPVVLVTGAHRSVAEAVARHVGGFSQVLATSGREHLVGERKRDMLVGLFGEGKFDYLGDSLRDIPVWKSAGTAYLAPAGRGTERELHRNALLPAVVGTAPSTWRALAKELRIHQWSKSILVFGAAALGHLREPERWLAALGAFVAFALASSSVYLLNDLMDLEADRVHPEKSRRPLAAGTFPVLWAMLLAPLLVLLSLAVAAAVSLKVMAAIAAYLIASNLYSAVLKRMLLLDVMTLASLYLLRLQTGGLASNVKLSFWTLLFSLFLFTSLALMKRCSELKNLAGQSNGTNRRSYRPEDIASLTALGACASLTAVLVVALYINSPDVRILYGSPDTLWLMCPIILAWCCRLWILTGRGEMNEDPVAFSLRDRWSQVSGLLVVGVFFSAL